MLLISRRRWLTPFISSPTLPWSQRFFLIFLRERDQEQAAKRRQRVAKATRRERKTSGYLGLESHFHSDDRVRIWPSGVDWLTFFQTRKPIWLACLIVTTEGTVRIFIPHFASLYQGRKLFVCCTRNNICTGPRHVKARHISRFWHGCCSWKNIRRNFDLGTSWTLSWVSLSNKITITITFIICIAPFL